METPIENKILFIEWVAEQEFLPILHKGKVIHWKKDYYQSDRNYSSAEIVVLFNYYNENKI